MEKLQILVLLAGSGERFIREGIKTPKPFVMVNGKTILEWTIDSLPFIKNHTVDYSLTFAMNDKHKNYEGLLRSIYGNDIELIWFSKETQRGNLDTARQAVRKSKLIIYNDRPLLVLDGDNAYDGSEFFKYAYFRDDAAAIICHFNHIDDERKWSYAVIHNQDTVEKIIEKPSYVIPNGKPLIGTFFFGELALFIYSAMNIKNTVRGEFYMSQALQFLIKQKYCVLGYKVNNVIPLGTPNDVKKFGEMYENLY